MIHNNPTLIEHKGMRFLIMGAPTDDDIMMFEKHFEKHHVKYVVRACEPTYDTKALDSLGISVVELPFSDGEGPSDSIIDTWLEIVAKEFKGYDGTNSNRTIAVHCVAGLGRAPVLVALALIESGMDYLDSVGFIRSKRRGAINSRQLQFLESYRRRTAKERCGCVIQ